MRVYFIIAAIALQVLVLVVMAGQREYILVTGETVYLRTAPIDPRDPFRGDFVRLSYDLNQIDTSQLEPVPEKLPKGSVIYAMLRPDARNVAMVQDYRLEEPDDGLYLRGRTRNHWSGKHNYLLRAKFGIETYFVQQGKGLEIEERQGRRSTMQVPLEMELAVGGNGTAIIRGHRWSPLGIQLEIPQARTDQDTPPAAPRLTLGLLNASDQPLAVVDLPDHCSFTLEPDTRWSRSTWTLAHDPCGNIQAQADHLVVLQPGEIHSVTLDLARPRWHVRTQAGEVVPIGRLPNQRFRLVYRAPDAGDGPRGSAPVWRGELPSPAFWAAGRVD